ncbi:protein unc-13-like protein [Senna tora]|uniref:Protein unc-13-like protein n=1 Tax=Senna tora TaxID=362788 RepID=A0A834W3D3_9FABA|nr:protein unc-13-like protein [Senna tora]
MGQHNRRESDPGPFYSSVPRPHTHHCRDLFDKENDLVWPFGKLEGLDDDDIRQAAYEIFFTACRSSPGFGGKTALTFYSNHENNNEGGSKLGQVVTPATPTSKVKRALGLKMLKRSPSRRMSGSCGGLTTPTSPSKHGQGGASSPLSSSSRNGYDRAGSLSNTLPPVRPRRPMTSAEIMRQQMRVSEQSDSRLRKTLMRTLVGQMGKRAESIILPLELLRHIKPSEFSDSHEYHLWQKRQLKILEVGLLIHPLIPIEKSNPLTIRLKEIIHSAEAKPLDTNKTSDTMRVLCNSVVSLSWRTTSGAPTDVCHWADGFPVNIQLYISLLQSIFDIRDETQVLDEVDELLDLMKKTWSTFGINKAIHNVCFAWVFFYQYVMTGQIESDLLCASHAMLTEVAVDAKKERDSSSFYVKILASMLSSMMGWAEKRLRSYHEYFVRGASVGQIENLLPLVMLGSKILGEHLSNTTQGDRKDVVLDSSEDKVDQYIRFSMKNAFGKIIEAANVKFAKSEIKEDVTQVLLQLAQETEDLAMKERQNYSPILKKWHITAGAVAALTLHSCYAQVLNQYLNEVASLTTDTVEVLHRAAKLEKVLVQMVVEDSADCEDGGKTIVREMVPYEVDTIILNLVKKWIDESLNKCRELFQRAKETETWNPKSKQEPYAQSAVELVRVANLTVEEFFRIPVGITEDLVQELAIGLESLFREYMTFVAACGSKKSYIPSLPPLTRCNRDSKLSKMWKITNPCSYGLEEHHIHGGSDNLGHNPRPSTSRGTQRLYIRLNTLHFLLTHIHAIDKTLSLTPGVIISASILAACQHVSEVAAYRLIFLDSNSVFYDWLYMGDVAGGASSIRPTLRTLKQNLTLMVTILTEKAQAVAMKEAMRACFDAFLMVLLAGGSNRVYNRSDHQQIHDDFEDMKRIFVCCGEGLISEEKVQREGEVVEGVVSLMGQSTEQLMEDFSIVTCETSGLGVIGNGQKLPMPPTTRRWHRADPNTILRVLCHRNDKVANQFLKRTFQLAKRK